MSTTPNVSAALAALATTDTEPFGPAGRDRALAALSSDPTSAGDVSALEGAMQELRPHGEGDDPVRTAYLAAVRAGGDDATANIVAAAAQAAAGHYRRSPADVEAAVARGVAVSEELEQVLSEALAGRGWWPPGIIGPLAGCVAAARLAGLDVTRANSAIGIAATQAAGLAIGRGTTAEAAGRGAAAAAAVEAVVLVDHGFSGPPQGVDGRRGLLPALFDGALEEPVREQLERRLRIDASSGGR